MNKILCGAAVAASLCLVAGAANAVTFSEVDYNGSNDAPIFGTPAPLVFTPTFHQADSGSIGGNERSPYETNSSNADAAYSVLAPGGQSGAANATYGISSAATSFEILWGSPDDYNTANFYKGINLAYSLNGNQLACYSGGCKVGDNRIGWADVTFSFNAGDVSSVVLVDSGQAAFEYGLNTAGIIPGPTPLPAALPLFGTVLGGGLLFGRLRKRRKA